MLWSSKCDLEYLKMVLEHWLFNDTLARLLAQVQQLMSGLNDISITIYTYVLIRCSSKTHHSNWWYRGWRTLRLCQRREIPSLQRGLSLPTCWLFWLDPSNLQSHHCNWSISLVWRLKLTLTVSFHIGSCIWWRWALPSESFWFALSWSYSLFSD